MWFTLGLAAALLVPAPVVSDSAPTGEVRAALAALHGWDGARAAAYAAGDARRLTSLYTPGSSAGAADLRVLRSYEAHGWRITAMATQVRSVRVLAHEADRWTLRTVDRVRALADTPERCRALAARRYRTHELVLVRSGGSWQVARVSSVRSPARR